MRDIIDDITLILHEHGKTDVRRGFLRVHFPCWVNTRHNSRATFISRQFSMKYGESWFGRAQMGTEYRGCQGYHGCNSGLNVTQRGWRAARQGARRGALSRHETLPFTATQECHELTQKRQKQTGAAIEAPVLIQIGRSDLWADAELGGSHERWRVCEASRRCSVQQNQWLWSKFILYKRRRAPQRLYVLMVNYVCHFMSWIMELFV